MSTAYCPQQLTTGQQINQRRVTLAEGPNKEAAAAAAAKALKTESASAGAAVHHIEFNTDSVESLQKIQIPFKFRAKKTAIVHGMGAFVCCLFPF